MKIGDKKKTHFGGYILFKMGDWNCIVPYSKPMLIYSVCAYLS